MAWIGGRAGGKALYQIDPCECSYGIEVARFADDSVDLGHGRQFLPILRDSGYHL